MERKTLYALSGAGLVGAGLVAGLLLQPRVTPTAVTGNCPAGSNNGTVRPDAAFRIYWCQPSGDHLEGAYLTGLPAGKTQLDNVVINRGPFEDNLVQWSGAVPAQARGNYTIQVVAQNFGVEGNPATVQDSPPSAPFGLGVADTIGVPAAPIRMRVDPGNPSPVTRAPVDNRRP